MKMKVTTTGRLAALAVAVALLTNAAVANAQEKGAAKLMQLSAVNATPAAAASVYKAMSCADCKDSFVTVADKEIKGAGAVTLVTGGPPTRTVAKHSCGSCSNEWALKGHGKAKVSVPVHKCSACG